MVIISVKNMITMVVVDEKELNEAHRRLADEQASYWQSLTRELAGGTGGCSIYANPFHDILSVSIFCQIPLAFRFSTGSRPSEKKVIFRGAGEYKIGVVLQRRGQVGGS